MIGAKNFSEQYILAEPDGRRGSKRAAAPSSRKEGLGSAIAYRALAGGEIDAYVDYSGTLWTNVLNRTRHPAARGGAGGADRRVHARRDGVIVLGALGFENAYALAMRARPGRGAAASRTIADLAPLTPRLTLGADLEFLPGPEWAALQARLRLDVQAQEKSFSRPSCTGRSQAARST